MSERHPVQKMLEVLAPEAVKESLPEFRYEMRLHNLFRGACGRFLPAPPTIRQVDFVHELFERVDGLCRMGRAGIYRSENCRQNGFCLRFLELGLTAQGLALAHSVLPQKATHTR